MADTRHPALLPASVARDGVAIEVFFDGDCPLCLREVRMVRRRDRRRRIRFTDIAAQSFDAGGLGMTQAELMERMHGRLPDGRVISGVEVFRRMYAAIGFGGLVALSRLPGITWVLDAAYAFFARHRLLITGRCRAGVCARPRRPAKV